MGIIFGIMFGIIIILTAVGVIIIGVGGEDSIEFTMGWAFVLVILSVIVGMSSDNYNYLEGYIRYDQAGNRYTCKEYEPLLKLVTTVDTVVSDSTWENEK